MEQDPHLVFFGQRGPLFDMGGNTFVNNFAMLFSGPKLVASWMHIKVSRKMLKLQWSLAEHTC